MLKTGNQQLPSDPAPVAFSFKEEGFLAAHPPSCHPRRVFGCPKSGKKMKENEGRGERGRSTESFSTILFIDGSTLSQTLTPSYVLLKAREVTKKTKTKSYYKDKFGINKKL